MSPRNGVALLSIGLIISASSLAAERPSVESGPFTLECKGQSAKYSIALPGELDALAEGAFVQPFRLNVWESDLNGPILKAKVTNHGIDLQEESLIQYSVKNKVVSVYVLASGGYCGISLDHVQGRRTALNVHLQCEFEPATRLRCRMKN